MAVSETVADLFRAARTAKGLTLEQVARRANMSFSTVIRTESGNITPKAENLFDLCDVLGVPYDELRAVLPSRADPVPA